jgi:ribosome modulation factor
MAKARKTMTQAEWEGAQAAEAGRGRSGNPYPQSDMASRDAWFAGYDAAAERMSRAARKSRIPNF